MRKFWKRIFPRDVREIETTGTEARVQAERKLAETVVECARTREQTPYYEGLGRDLRGLRNRNHIAEHLRESLRLKGA
jgi:hypothetical protein